MTTTTDTAHFGQIDEQEYKRRIRAWTMYDWANSAFVTTVMAAVLPVYYSGVAGATLPSEAAATALWSMGLSISLFITAIMSPILGIISDIRRGKKRFLAFFVSIGIIATGLMVLISTGDWLMASILFIIGRIGFTAANVFYDALLPHVAKPADQDEVSTRGYAMGYIGGGILLAVNIVMINTIPDFFEFAGVRLSLLSVALWWLIFSIPMFRRIPEPPAVTRQLAEDENVISASFKQLRETFNDIQRYKELFKFLIAFLIYNDGIGTIIGVATIYGAELGLGTTELILALLLVQFVGIPFSLVFGRLPSKETRYRPQFLAFVLFNIIMLPLAGIGARLLLPTDITGVRPEPYQTIDDYQGEGLYAAYDIELSDDWTEETIPAEALSGGGFFDVVNNLFGEPLEDTVYMTADAPDAKIDFKVNGQRVKVKYRIGPNSDVWAVMVDGEPLPDRFDDPITIDASSDTERFNVTEVITLPEPGQHTLTLMNNADGGRMMVTSMEVLPPLRINSLPIIMAMVFGLNLVGVLFAALLGKPLFNGLAETLDTKRSVILALLVYAVIAIWGFFVDSTVEFWFLAWMVAVVQGGSQALSRSLYSNMSPAAKSGEFFGLFGVMEKFSAILGPILFALAGTLLGSSRPAILSLIIFFIVGIILLTRVDVDEGRRVAAEEDQLLLGSAP